MWGSTSRRKLYIGRGPDQGYRRCDAEIKATWAACADHAAAARAREAPRSPAAEEAARLARRRRREAARATRDDRADRRRLAGATSALGAGAGHAGYTRRFGGRLAVPVAHERYSLARRGGGVEVRARAGGGAVARSLLRGGAHKAPAAPAPVAPPPPPPRPPLRVRYLHARGREKLRAAARPPPDAPDAPGSPPASAPRPNAAPPPPPKNVVVATVVGWRGAAARGRAGAALRVFLVARGGRRRLVGDVPLRLHLPGAVATGTRVATTARPGDRHVVLDVVGPADDVVASRKLGLGALAADGDAAAAPRWVRFAKDAHVMLGVELSARAAPPAAVSREAAPAAPPAAPPRRRRRTDWLSAGESSGPVLIQLVRAPGGVASLQIREGAGLCRRVVGAAEAAVGGAAVAALVERGAALRLAVRRGAGAATLRFHGDAWAGQRRLALRGGAAPASGAAAVVRLTPLAGTLVAIKVAAALPPGRTPRRVAPPEPHECLVHDGALHCFRAGEGFARRIALAGAAVDRVAVRGATLVLAVAPPDAPGRILLDASGLSPDAGEAFAATVFAAAEAPRGRVIP